MKFHLRPKNENESHLIILVFFIFIHSVTKSVKSATCLAGWLGDTVCPLVCKWGATAPSASGSAAYEFVYNFL